MAQGNKNENDCSCKELIEYKVTALEERDIYVINGDSVDAMVIREKPYEEDETSIYEYDYECLYRKKGR